MRLDLRIYMALIPAISAFANTTRHFLPSGSLSFILRWLDNDFTIIGSRKGVTLCSGRSNKMHWHIATEEKCSQAYGLYKSAFDHGLLFHFED